MSDHQEIIDAMMSLAATDVGNRVTCDDLDQCETAALTIQDLEAENKTLRGDLDSVRGHPSATYCGICERPLERCQCDETIMELKAELSALRSSVRQKSVRATEQQLRNAREALDAIYRRMDCLETFDPVINSICNAERDQREPAQ